MNDNRQRRSKWDSPEMMGGGPSTMPFNVVKGAEDPVSSLEAASAAAARINAMLISKGKLKLPAPPVPNKIPQVVNLQEKQIKPQLIIKDEKTKSESLVAEVEINEVPIQCRNLLTKGNTQEEISRLTGAALSTRGRYMSYADRATNNMGERPLYLCVQGPTKECVEKAVDHIKAVINNGIHAKFSKSPKERAHSRFSAASTSGPTPSFSTQPPGLGLNMPPAQGMPGAGVRGPSVGGDVRGPAVVGLAVRPPGAQQTPIVPPPAIQMAIQAAHTSGHYLQDKVFVGLEHADPSFNIRDKVQGPGVAFLQHIRAETGANVYLRGRGSGFMEPTSGREAFENLYIYVTHPKSEGLQAAKKLCENLVNTIQAEYMTHQSQLFQRSAPAMAAAHMIAGVPPRPSHQPLQQTIQTIQQPVAVGMIPQAPPPMTSMAVNTSLSQTLAAQQQAQAIMAAQRPAVSTVMVSLPQGISYPQLQPQVHVAVANHPGLPLPARAPQPVPAPAPVPPPQAPAPMPVVSQTALYPAQQATQPQQAQQVQQGQHAQQAQPGQHGLIRVQPHPGAQMAQMPQPQSQPQPQMPQCQMSQVQMSQAQPQMPQPQIAQMAQAQMAQPQLAQVQGQVQVRMQAVQPPPQVGIQVAQPQPMLQQQLPPPQQQPMKRRFREDLPPDRPEHHPLPMTNLGVPPPGHVPVGMATGGQSSLLGLPRASEPDRRLMPPPPTPQQMRDPGRKIMMPPPGLDIHGGRMPSPDEPRMKRERLVSYETGGDSDEDEDAAARSRNRYDPAPRFPGSSPPGGYMPPPRGLSPTSMSLSSQGSSPYLVSTSSTTTSPYYKPERRDPGPGPGPGVGSSPFWMARN